MGLIDLLPEYYKNSDYVTDLQNSFEYWTDFLYSAKNSVLEQLNVDTATWGLKLWESQLGLETDINKTYAFRRERIKAKLRGAGTVTKQMIKEVAKAYSNGEVEVIEDAENYSFKVKFVGTKGIPANMADLTLTIEEIKPAHLAYTFEYTYNTWKDVKDLTWGEASTYTWNQLRVR